MIDFHSHLIPGVDDGANDELQAREALARMRDEGVSALITTPHLNGSLTARPAALAERLAELDAGWDRLRAIATAEFPELRVERGVEVMLDTPEIDLSDPRLRLAGTPYVLVEFPYMNVPPNSAQTLFELKLKGWIPVVAHPERYSGVDEGLAVMDEWRRVGGLFQVNGASLIGRYGGNAQTTAWRLLKRGWVDYLSSDYHARGRVAVREARARLEEKGGAAQATLLMETNPARLLAGEAPEPVPPLLAPRKPLWRRLFG